MDGKKFLQFPQRYLHSWSLWFITMRETKPLRDHSPPSCLIRADISLELTVIRNSNIYGQSLLLKDRVCSGVWGAGSWWPGASEDEKYKYNSTSWDNLSGLSTAFLHIRHHTVHTHSFRLSGKSVWKGNSIDGGTGDMICIIIIRAPAIVQT